MFASEKPAQFSKYLASVFLNTHVCGVRFLLSTKERDSGNTVTVSKFKFNFAWSHMIDDD